MFFFRTEKTRWMDAFNPKPLATPGVEGESIYEEWGRCFFKVTSFFSIFWVKISFQSNSKRNIWCEITAGWFHQSDFNNQRYYTWYFTKTKWKYKSIELIWLASSPIVVLKQTFQIFKAWCSLKWHFSRHQALKGRRQLQLLI